MLLLLESPQLTCQTVPNASSKASKSSCYILHIAPLSSSFYAVASSQANNKHGIDLVDKSTLKTVLVLTRGGNVTSLRNVDGDDNILVSAGKDGSVRFWDGRVKECCLELKNPKNRALLSLAIHGTSTIAAGSELTGKDAFIFYWDARSPPFPLRTHSSTHSDDITTLSFHHHRPSSSPLPPLLSGSSDGLLCISNALEQDEDEAILHVTNWGSSVSQAGWIFDDDDDDHHHPKHRKIWSASDMETFGIWNEELDPLVDLDIRSPALHTSRTRWSTDYLVTTHTSRSCIPKLSVFTGNNQGDIALLSTTNTSTPWCLHKVWKGGHEGIVRSLFWDEENQILLTGGEDSKLNAWAIDPILDNDDDNEDESMSIKEDDENIDEMMDTRSERGAKTRSPKSRKRRNGSSERKGKKVKYDS